MLLVSFFGETVSSPDVWISCTALRDRTFKFTPKSWWDFQSLQAIFRTLGDVLSIDLQTVTKTWLTRKWSCRILRYTLAEFSSRRSETIPEVCLQYSDVWADIRIPHLTRTDQQCNRLPANLGMLTGTTRHVLLICIRSVVRKAMFILSRVLSSFDYDVTSWNAFGRPPAPVGNNSCNSCRTEMVLCERKTFRLVWWRNVALIWRKGGGTRWLRFTDYRSRFERGASRIRMAYTHYHFVIPDR